MYEYVVFYDNFKKFKLFENKFALMDFQYNNDISSDIYVYEYLGGM